MSAVRATAASSSTASSTESPTPSECASIGHSPGPTDHMYNAGTRRTLRHFRASLRRPCWLDPRSPMFDGTTGFNSDDVDRLPLHVCAVMASAAPSDSRDRSVLLGEEVLDNYLLVLISDAICLHDQAEAFDSSKRSVAVPLVIQVVVGNKRACSGGVTRDEHRHHRPEYLACRRLAHDHNPCRRAMTGPRSPGCRDTPNPHHGDTASLVQNYRLATLCIRCASEPSDSPRKGRRDPVLPKACSRQAVRPT